MSRQRADLPGEEVRPLSALAAELPYPLGMKLRALLQGHRRRIEGEPEPQLAFELCAVMGVLIRFVSFIAIRAYVDAGGTDARLNHLIVSRLRAPTDGGWLEVGQRLAKALDGAEAAPLIRLLASAFKERPALPPAVRQQARGATGPGKALSGLVRFRNALVHGEPQTEADLARALALLEVAVRGFAGLSRYRLQVRHAGRTWWLTGAVPRPGPDRPDLPPDEPCLVAIDADDPPMSLSPLLRFRAGEGDDALDLAFDELLFLNAGSAERLSYIGYRTAGQVDGRQLGSYDAFKSFVSRIPTPPIPSEPPHRLLGAGSVSQPPLRRARRGASGGSRHRRRSSHGVRRDRGACRHGQVRDLRGAAPVRHQPGSSRRRACLIRSGRADPGWRSVGLPLLHAHGRPRQSDRGAALAHRPDLRPGRLGPEAMADRTKIGKLLVYDGDRYGLFHDRFRRFLVGAPRAQVL